MGRRGKRHNGIDVDGFLLVDKAPEWTSHDAVGMVRGRHKINKVGHGGTLDPMATGLLVLLLGKCTKRSEWVMQGDKVYEGTMTLGATTDSQDADGKTLETQPVPELSEADILDAFALFTGDIEQVPPMVSAIKKNGVPLYKLARQGKTIEREPRPVTIHRLELLSLSLPEIHFRTRCTKGTYVRTLAHDIGQHLGCGAHLSALRRTESGRFNVKDAVEVEGLREMDLDTLKQHLIAPEDLLPDEADSRHQS